GDQRALFEHDIGPQEHVRLQRYLFSVGADVRSVEGCGYPVGRLFEREWARGVVAGQDRLRDVRHAAAVRAELLIRERFIENPDFLTGLHETRGSGRNEQLRLEHAVIWDDLHL